MAVLFILLMDIAINYDIHNILGIILFALFALHILLNSSFSLSVLKNFNNVCTGCSRHCTLLRPQCDIVESRADTAAETYNTSYIEETDNQMTIYLMNNKLLNYSSIMGLYIAGTYYIIKFAGKIKKI